MRKISEIGIMIRRLFMIHPILAGIKVVLKNWNIYLQNKYFFLGCGIIVPLDLIRACSVWKELKGIGGGWRD